MVKTLREIFDQPETMWLQFRRLDKLEPFCRIAGHTSEEVREILAALETVYREIFPHLNLRQWSGAIYTWLTQPVLDPTNSGRVTMDFLTNTEDQTFITQTGPTASHDAGMDQKPPVKSPKCTFSGVVPIDLKLFLDSGIGRVECPDCACTRTLKPQGGVLQFKSHDKRKTSTPNTGSRWAKVETDWDVVGK